MKRWLLLSAIGWLASMAWFFDYKGPDSTLWEYLQISALLTSLPTLVSLLIVLRLWRCDPSQERTLGILSLPFIGGAIACWQMQAMRSPGVYLGFSDFLMMSSCGALPGFVAWFGFLFPPDLP